MNVILKARGCEKMPYSVINNNEGYLLENKTRSVKIIKSIFAYLLLVLILILCLPCPAISQDKDDISISVETRNLRLKQAVMCEDIKDLAPYNAGVVFPSNLGRILCFTEFDPVLEKTVIYHKYYFMDKLSAKKKLTLNPPRWAAFSYIEPRETDKGPWRVEIVDTEDNILHILRFSITD
jgi:hypothetical protein